MPSRIDRIREIVDTIKAHEEAIHTLKKILIDEHDGMTLYDAQSVVRQYTNSLEFINKWNEEI